MPDVATASARAQRDAEDDLFAGLTATQRDQLRALLLLVRGKLTPERNIPCNSADSPDA